jgi:hypothetical protein
MIPTNPNWEVVVGDLYRVYGSYSAILNAMVQFGIAHSDHAFLCYLRSGKRKKVGYEYGAALMNLHSNLRAEL